MRPAISIIFLTTLIGAGQGLFLALYTGQLYSTFKVLPVQDPLQFYALGSLFALGLLGARSCLAHFSTLDARSAPGVRPASGARPGCHVK